MSVHGLSRFAEAMEAWRDSYVLIGGSACDLLAGSFGVEFRATKDLDVVIILDEASQGFAEALWGFVKAGGYEAWQDKHGEARFYRFEKPNDPSCPYMIELFSRHPDFELGDEESEIAPLPFSEDILSLSAIVLDDEYYDFICSGVISVDEVSVLDAAHLIPLKMKAHIDLSRRKAGGAHVNSVDLKKHRKDVVRLLELVPEARRLELSGDMRRDALIFLETVNDPAFRTDQIVEGMDKAEVVRRLRAIYELA